MNFAPGTTSPDLIRSYFHLKERPHPHRHPRDEDPDFWAWEEIFEAVDSDPNRAWNITLDLIDAAPDDGVLSYVAAGPLEELLKQHSAVFIDRYDEMARRWPKFRSALNRIFLPDDDKVLNRLGRYLDPTHPQLKS